MFVIFGLGPKEKIEATGMFVCPRCRIKKEYKVKSSVEYFRLFFIPILPTGEKKETYVECQSCQRTYYTDTLENNNYNLDSTPFKKNDYDIEVKVDSDETHIVRLKLDCQRKKLALSSVLAVNEKFTHQQSK